MPITEELPNWAKNCEMNFKIRVANTLFVPKIGRIMSISYPILFQ